MQPGPHTGRDDADRHFDDAFDPPAPAVIAHAPVPGTHPLVRASRHSLLRRLFVVNAIVLIGAFSFFVFTPATISQSVVIKELVVVVVAVAASLGLNFLLLRRTLGPLGELREI